MSTKLTQSVRSPTEPTRPNDEAPARAAVRALVDWFLAHQRVLPWRTEPTPYRVWVSEIMLQQTQVVTVGPYFERFVARFPTLESLAQAPIEDVLVVWQGLGYYSRARNLHAAARQMVASGVPTTLAGWLELPGVGPYTAGAVCSIALGLPEAIVDGNVERVLSRVHRLPERGACWGASRAWVDTAVRAGVSISALNQGLMELGARVCGPRTPACASCPLASHCAARKQGDVHSFPAPKPRTVTRAVNEHVRVYWDRRADQVWLASEVGSRWRRGLWDFPPGQADEPLYAFELKYVVTRHRVTRRHDVCDPPEVASSGGEALGVGRWVSRLHPDVPIGAPTRRALARLSSRLQK